MDGGEMGETGEWKKESKDELGLACKIKTKLK